jgi:hypothetical protein
MELHLKSICGFNAEGRGFIGGFYWVLRLLRFLGFFFLGSKDS